MKTTLSDCALAQAFKAPCTHCGPCRSFRSILSHGFKAWIEFAFWTFLCHHGFSLSAFFVCFLPLLILSQSSFSCWVYLTIIPISPSKRNRWDLGLRVQRPPPPPTSVSSNPPHPHLHPTSHSCLLSFSLCHLSFCIKTQNGEPAPSPCLSLGSWVRGFTHILPVFYLVPPQPPPQSFHTVTSHFFFKLNAFVEMGKSSKGKKKRSTQLPRIG